MTKENEPENLKTKAADARRRLSDIATKAQGLEEAATAGLQPRIDRLETMVAALERDAQEVSADAGADRATAEELNRQVEAELSNLAIEVETMSQGNPTTISAAVDAVGKVIGKSSGK